MRRLSPLRPGGVIGQPWARLLLGLLAIILCLGAPFYASLWWTQHGPPYSEVRNYISHKSPISLSRVPAPPLVQSLLASISPLDRSLWPTHPLPAPLCPLALNVQSPLLLSVHVFSNARFGVREAKKRRASIRRMFHMGVPHKYRYLVQLRFIMGRSWDPAQETLHDREEKVYGDMVRLGIPEGDGERGKAAEWLSVIGAEGRHVAQWVVKCEDDVLPILPNLIPYLVQLDPTQPIIIGSSLKTDRHLHPHFSKQMYGFSWGVVRSIAAAKLSDEEKQADIQEGELIGRLMYSLPSKPGQPILPVQSPIPHSPTSPDPRTGLVWVDVGNKISRWREEWWASRGSVALGWYGITEDLAYEETALAEIIRDIHAAGRRYVWDVPPHLKYLALNCTK